MMEFLQWVDQIPLGVAILAALVIGLSPFFPEPHIWEKLKMLKAGTLTRPLDIFDFLLHATPIVLLIVKFARMPLL